MNNSYYDFFGFVDLIDLKLLNDGVLRPVQLYLKSNLKKMMTKQL